MFGIILHQQPKKHRSKLNQFYITLTCTSKIYLFEIILDEPIYQMNIYVFKMERYMLFMNVIKKQETWEREMLKENVL